MGRLSHVTGPPDWFAAMRTTRPDRIGPVVSIGNGRASQNLRHSQNGSQNMATKRKSVTSPWFYDVSVSFDGAVYTLARRDRWSPPGATVVETVVTDSMEDAAYVLAYYFADDRSTDTWMQGSVVMAMFSAVGVSGVDIITAMDAGWSGMFDATEGLLRDVDPGAPLTDIYGALLGTRES